MHLVELERAGRGAIEEATIAHGELSGARAVPAGCERCTGHAQALVPRQLYVGADVRREGPHASLEQVGALLRVEPAVLGPNLFRVRYAGVGLLSEGGLEIERLHEELAAERGEPSCQRAVRVARPDCLSALHADRAGVELRGE